MGIFDGLDYLIWIRNVLAFLGYPQGTTTIFQDNTSTITMAYMGRGSSGSKTRHIDIKYFYIKQFLDSKDLEIDHLGRDNMTADFFASPRQGTVFRRFRGMIMGEIVQLHSLEISYYDINNNNNTLRSVKENLYHPPQFCQY